MSLENFIQQLSSASNLAMEEFGLSDHGMSNSFFVQELGKLGAPAEVVSLLFERFNGQTGVTNLFGEFNLLPIAEIQNHWEINNSEFGHQESPSSDPRIRAGFGWQKLWLPFAWDSDFNRLLILDFAPSNKGTPGQVFMYDCRDTPGEFLATDLSHFLNDFFSKLESSSFKKDDTGQFVSRVIELS